MAFPKTAQQELMRRIKQLSAEEAEKSRQIGVHQGDIRRLEGEREELATMRRQYEFALKTLDGEDVTRIVIDTHDVPGGQIVKVKSRT